MALTAIHPVPTVLFARPPFTAFTCDVTAIEGKSESDYTHPSPCMYALRSTAPTLRRTTTTTNPTRSPLSLNSRRSRERAEGNLIYRLEGRKEGSKDYANKVVNITSAIERFQNINLKKYKLNQPSPLSNVNPKRDISRWRGGPDALWYHRGSCIRWG